MCLCSYVCRTVCTVPLIDYIDGNEYSMEPQQGGDEDGLARGAWDWSLLWKRVPLSQREKAQRKHTTQPYRYIHRSQHANTHPCSVCFLHIPSPPSHLSYFPLYFVLSPTPHSMSLHFTGTAVRICPFSSFSPLHFDPLVSCMHDPTPTLSERCVPCL